MSQADKIRVGSPAASSSSAPSDSCVNTDTRARLDSRESEQDILGHVGDVRSRTPSPSVHSSENQKNILTDLGLNALLAYGFVSNLSYITCTWLAWLSHSKATKTSPLYPGQWKVFLTFYAGYW